MPANEMNAEDIKKIIADELGGRETVPNWHGISLEKCLVEPVKQEYEDSFNKDEVVKLWLVLEERPDDGDGYKIVFDEEMNEFGLATPGNGLDVFIGYYGSFLETLEGM
jgi:hypothetical protein